MHDTRLVKTAHAHITHGHAVMSWSKNVHKLRQRTKFGEKKSSGQNPSSSSADLVQVDDLTANQQLSRDRSPSLSPSTSSLTLSSGATVVLDEVNSDG